MTVSTRLVLPSIMALLASCHQPPPPTPVEPLATLNRTVSGAVAGTGGLVTVPQEAVVERGGLAGVFVLLHGRARFQTVRTGHREGGKVEVLSGLRGGELLVTGDLAAVRDGTPITVRR